MTSYWLQVVVGALLLGKGEIFLLTGYVGCSEWYVPESSLFILTKVLLILGFFFGTHFYNFSWKKGHCSVISLDEVIRVSPSPIGLVAIHFKGGCLDMEVDAHGGKQYEETAGEDVQQQARERGLEQTHSSQLSEGTDPVDPRSQTPSL